ncbi:B12-binding domain-containing radical SAM protein [Candidatus Pelagibacter sp.]|nr:B12-binding domain-containing radical SAM protein [Candidatus Pelagibacter sp.]
MRKRDIWIADLTHTTQGISAATFPLGVSYVFSYAKYKFGNEFNFRLFKFPEHLSEALKKKLPSMLCFSNYSWNFELAYKFAYLVKKKDPSVITVFGGPNFPQENDEKLSFLKKRSSIDFYAEQEGELGMENIIINLITHNLSSANLKKQGKKISNTTYLSSDHELISGKIERIQNINNIPSPYLNGDLDEFFDLPLIPMIETTRGCPFSCSFCTDGLDIKNRVSRYDDQRTKDELKYIAKRVKKTDELIITDLNFAMYKQDLITADSIAGIQKEFQYPTIVSASAGKNLPKRTVEVASKMKGWTMGGSVQSSDPDVLKAIKRSNISTSSYKEMIRASNEQKDKKTHCEIILGLPGDTKQRHFESLRFGIDSEVNSMRMYQAMLLSGTEMASKESRKKHELLTKFRTIPGCIGKYDIFDKEEPVAEIEEIIVGGKNFSIDDYLDCRVMNLIVKTFFNNSMFEEVYSMLRAMNISPFDCLLSIKEHPSLYSEKVKEILKSFVKETTKDLYETFEEANQKVLTPEILNSYIGGELGNNELLLHRALLFNEFDDLLFLIFEATHQVLQDRSLLTPIVNDYLIDLKKFIICRKKNVLKNSGTIITEEFNFDFESIRDNEYNDNPNILKKLKTKVQLDFYQEKEQRKHIDSQLAFYNTHAGGLGRMLLRCNLKLFFRRFSKSRANKILKHSTDRYQIYHL